MTGKNLGFICDAYDTALTTATTYYFEIPVDASQIQAIHCSWFDATSNAAITLETSNWPVGRSSKDSTNADEWFAESGVTITGPTASARGCSMTHLGNLGAARARVKVVTSAATRLRIAVNAK